MPDQLPEDKQYPHTIEGGYRKAADLLRAELDRSSSSADSILGAKMLAELAIQMTAAQNGAGLTAVEPTRYEQGASQ